MVAEPALLSRKWELLNTLKVYSLSLSPGELEQYAKRIAGLRRRNKTVLQRLDQGLVALNGVPNRVTYSPELIGHGLKRGFSNLSSIQDRCEHRQDGLKGDPGGSR